MGDVRLVVRCVRFGLLAGAASGGGLGTLVVPVVGTLIDAFFGALIGVVVGAAEAVVLVPLLRAGAGRTMLVVAGGLVAGLIAWGFAGGVAGFGGWTLAALIGGTGVVGALLAPNAVRVGALAPPPVASDPVTPFAVAPDPVLPRRSVRPAARVAQAVLIAWTGACALLGLVIGLLAHWQTAWAAALELGLLGAFVGGPLALVVLASGAIVRRCGGHRASGATMSR